MKTCYFCTEKAREFYPNVPVDLDMGETDDHIIKEDVWLCEKHASDYLNNEGIWQQ